MVKVLFEDNSLIAVHKPANVAVSPSHRLRTGSMLNRVIAHLGPGLDIRLILCLPDLHVLSLLPRLAYTTPVSSAGF